MLLPGFESPIMRDPLDDLIAGLASPSGTTKPDNGINPTTDLPWGVYPDPSSPTGYTLTTTGQPVFKDGALYTGQVGAKGGSGGTSVTVYNPASVGANRYVTLTVPPGGDESGLPVGTVYQKDLGDNSIQVVQRPSANVNPADKNNDGLDDTTNMALGVYKDSNSPTGFSYGMGQPVYPNGAPYTGSGGGNIAEPNLKTINGRAVIWDPQKGMYVDAPGITQTSGPGSTPSNGSNSGGTYISAQTARVSSGGGGGSSSSSGVDYAAQYAQQTKMQQDANAFAASQNALDRAQKDQQFQAQYGLSVAQFQAQQAKDAAAARLGLIDRYGAAVSDTDQAKLQSLRMALSPNGTGDVSLVDLLRNAGPGAFQANEAAAALLGEIRGQPASPTGTGMAPVTTPAGAAGTGTPATGAPGMAPVTTPTGTTAANPGGGPITPQIIDANGRRIDNPAYITEQAALRQQEAQQQAYSARSGWFPSSEPGGIVYREYANGQPTGQVKSQADYSAMQNQNDQQTSLNTFFQGASVTPDLGGAGSGYWIRPKITDSLGQVSGTDYQTVAPWAAGYALPGAQNQPGMGNLSGDNIARPMPEGTVQPRATTTVAADTNPTQPTGFSPGQTVPTGGLQSGYTYDPSTNTYIPHAAHGTERPMMGPIVTGDPQVPGQPNPELTVWTPQGNIVRPLNTMHPMMRPVMDGLPHAALGTSVFNDPFARFGRTTPTTQPAPQPTAPTPVATTPTTTQPAPAPQQQPITQQPQPVTNTQPAMQPVTQPQPTTVGGTTVSTTPTPNPADPLALTPQSTQYINDVGTFRTDLQYPHLNQLDVSWGRLAPSLQQSNMQGVQTATGLPIADQQYWQNRFAFAGRPTMSTVQGW